MGMRRASSQVSPVEARHRESRRHVGLFLDIDSVDDLERPFERHSGRNAGYWALKITAARRASTPSRTSAGTATEARAAWLATAPPPVTAPAAPPAPPVTAPSPVRARRAESTSMPVLACASGR